MLVNRYRAGTSPEDEGKKDVEKKDEGYWSDTVGEKEKVRKREREGEK